MYQPSEQDDPSARSGPGPRREPAGSADREAKLEAELEADVARRLRNVCSKMTPRSFQALVHSISDRKRRWMQADEGFLGGP